MKFRVEFEREDDGRWIAAIESLPGVLAYGASLKQAKLKVEALALLVIAEQNRES
jgi:predicted RNase H-like HicB family nuclease